MKIYGLAHRLEVMAKDWRIVEGKPYIWTTDEAGTEFPPFFEDREEAEYYVATHPRKPGGFELHVVELDLQIHLDLPDNVP
jgi:hypothetical protein